MSLSLGVSSMPVSRCVCSLSLLVCLQCLSLAEVSWCVFVSLSRSLSSLVACLSRLCLSPPPPSLWLHASPRLVACFVSDSSQLSLSLSISLHVHVYSTTRFPIVLVCADLYGIYHISYMVYTSISIYVYVYIYV